MRAYAHRILLLALFGVWVLIAWPPLARQFANQEVWQQRLADRPMTERVAMVDYPAYIVAEQVKQEIGRASCRERV